MIKKISTHWFSWVVLLLAVLYTMFLPAQGIVETKKVVELPADDAFLPDEPVQWWYWTGNLETEQGREFGIEVVFFAFSPFVIVNDAVINTSLIDKDQLIQAAITDVEDNSFHFNNFLRNRTLPEKLEGQFNLSSGEEDHITAVGGNGSDVLHAEIDDYVFDLKLEAHKDPVIHYDGGAYNYNTGGYTYYYSRKTMKTTGTVSIKGETYKVTGSTWFDRQYGDLYQAIDKGWQWFAIELDNDTQIMVYDINGDTERLESFASITNVDGETTILGPDEFTVTVLDNWVSSNTGCTYPSGWKLNIADKEWFVEPMVKDQELQAKENWFGPIYWEGASRVSDRNQAAVGKAYVELNGYCKV